MRALLGLSCVLVAACEPRSASPDSLLRPSTKAESCVPTLVSPADGVTLAGSPTFEWSDDCGPVRLEVSPTADFALAESFYFGRLTTTSHKIKGARWSSIVDRLAGGGFWRVVAGSGTIASASEARSFTARRIGVARESIEATCAVSLSSPSADAVASTDASPDFTWSSTCDADVLEVSPDPAFPVDTTYRFGSVATDGFTVPTGIWTSIATDLADGGYWRVIGGALDGEHATEGRPFTVESDTTDPVDTGAIAETATQYHVRTDGSDTACDGSADAPASAAPACAFATAQQAIDTWDGGNNVVLIHAGTYDDCHPCWSGATQCSATLVIPSSQAGEDGGYNVIRASGDGPVLMEGGGTCGFFLWNEADYIQLGGLESGHGFDVGGDYTYDYFIETAYGAGLVTQRGVSYTKVLGNNFRRDELSSYPEGSLDAAVINYIWSGSHHQVEGNTIELGAVGVGIQVGDAATEPCGISSCDEAVVDCPEDILVKGNVITYDGTSTINDRHAGYTGNGARGVTVEHNYVQMGTPSTPATGSYLVSWRSQCHLDVNDNVLEGYGLEYGLYNFDHAGYTDQRHLIYNNTLVGSGDVAVYTLSCEDCEVRNNVVLGSSADAFNTAFRDYDYSGGCSGSGVRGYNAAFNVGETYATCGGVTYEGHDVTSDPKLELSGEHPLPYFAPMSTSPLLGAGYSGSEVPLEDFEGDAREASVDMGADQRF